MLVEHQTVKSNFLAKLVFVEVFVIEVGAEGRIEMPIREREANGTTEAIPYVIFGVGDVGAFREAHYKHGVGLPARKVEEHKWASENESRLNPYDEYIS
jgi:hypothetical protein